MLRFENFARGNKSDKAIIFPCKGGKSIIPRFERTIHRPLI